MAASTMPCKLQSVFKRMALYRPSQVRGARRNFGPSRRGQDQQADDGQTVAIGPLPLERGHRSLASSSPGRKRSRLVSFLSRTPLAGLSDRNPRATAQASIPAGQDYRRPPCRAGTAPDAHPPPRPGTPALRLGLAVRHGPLKPRTSAVVTDDRDLLPRIGTTCRRRLLASIFPSWTPSWPACRPGHPPDAARPAGRWSGPPAPRVDLPKDPRPWRPPPRHSEPLGGLPRSSAPHLAQGQLSRPACPVSPFGARRALPLVRPALAGSSGDLARECSARAEKSAK